MITFVFSLASRRSAVLLAAALSLPGAAGAGEVLASEIAGMDLRLQQAFDLDFMAQGSGWAARPLIDPRLFATRPRDGGGAGYLTSRSDLRLGRQITGRLTVTGSYGAEDPEPGWRARVLEGWVSVSDDEQIQRLVAGKQKINWSQDTTFHLLDLVGRANARRSSVGLHEYDPYLKEGVVALRQMGSAGGLRWDLVFADAGRNQIRPGTWQAAGRLSTSVEGNDVAVLIERTRGHAVRGGFSFSRNFGDDWGLYVEALQSGEREIPRLEEAAPAIPVGPGLTLPALSRFAAELPKRDTTQALISVRRNVAEIGLIELSYFFNGNGLGADEWRGYTAALRTAGSTYRGAFLPFYPSAAANPNGAFLGDAARRGEWQLMRRHYVDLRFDTLEAFAFGRVEANVLTGLEDGGTTVMLTLRRPVAARVIASPFVIGTFAPGGAEAATVPTALIVGLGLHASF